MKRILVLVLALGVSHPVRANYDLRAIFSSIGQATKQVLDTQPNNQSLANQYALLAKNIAEENTEGCVQSINYIMVILLNGLHAYPPLEAHEQCAYHRAFTDINRLVPMFTAVLFTADASVGIRYHISYIYECITNYALMLVDASKEIPTTYEHNTQDEAPTKPNNKRSSHELTDFATNSEKRRR